MIPYGRQSIDDDDIAAVVRVLKGDWLTQGPHVAEFEEALAARVGARHAVAFSSGTLALNGAAAAAGLGPGDVVATTALSFVASANCARGVGASVTFVDIDPGTLNLDPSAVPADVDGLVAVHYAGLPVDLARLAVRPRVVIEDACHALGASTPDGPVGNCARSDLCVFSFHPVKAITTGEGGAVTTNDDGLADALRRFRNHGIVRTPEDGGWAYVADGPGTNARLTDLQAALGTSQLGKLDRFVDRRRALADRYRARLGALGLPLQLPPDRAARVRARLAPVRGAGGGRPAGRLRRAAGGRRRRAGPLRADLPPPGLRRWRRRRLPGHRGGLRRPALPALFPDLSDGEQDVVIEKVAEVLS